MKNIFSLRAIYEWRYYLSASIIVALIGITRFFALNRLPSGLADVEIENLVAAASFDVLATPLNGVYFMILHLLHEIGLLTQLSLRVISAVIGVVVIGLLYILLKEMLTRRTAIYGSVLATLSTWLLFASRIGSPEILLLLWILLLTLLMQYALKKDKAVFYVLGGVVLGLGLYTPLFIYFGLPLLMLYAFFDYQESARINWSWLIVPSVSIVVVAPVIYALSTQSITFSTYLQLDSFTLSTLDPIALFKVLLAGTNDVGLFHGQFAPYIDIATAVFALYALLWFGKNRRNTFFWLSIFVLSVSAFMWLAFSEAPATTFVLSAGIILLAAAGVEQLLERWYNVFPRNPIARQFALIPIFFLFLFIGAFHIRNYFVAFPKTPGSAEVYHETAPTILEYVTNNNLGDETTIIADSKTIERIQKLDGDQAQLESPPINADGVDTQTVIIDTEIGGIKLKDEYKLKEVVTSKTRNYRLFRVFEK